MVALNDPNFECISSRLVIFIRSPDADFQAYQFVLIILNFCSAALLFALCELSVIQYH